jgi:acetylornithine/succinyldiaminopimelate/putrescine aminotransferase
VKSNSVEIGIDKNNNIEVKNGKATVSIDKDGNVTIDAQGKLDFKNQGTSLQKVIDGLATELENLVTTGSPATQTTSPATKTSIGLWRSSKLNVLLKS